MLIKISQPIQHNKKMKADYHRSLEAIEHTVYASHLNRFPFSLDKDFCKEFPNVFQVIYPVNQKPLFLIWLIIQESSPF